MEIMKNRQQTDWKIFRDFNHTDDLPYTQGTIIQMNFHFHCVTERVLNIIHDFTENI